MKLSGPMKPETLERRARERAEAQRARRVDLRKRLHEKAERDGPDSIWAEMLEEIREEGA